MKVHRGPMTDDSWNRTELVDNQDLSKTKPWIKTKSIEANITKEGLERQSVAHIEFSERDVLALHRALVQGLARRAQEADRLEDRASSLMEALRLVVAQVDGFRLVGWEEALSQIRNIARSALKEP